MEDLLKQIEDCDKMIGVLDSKKSEYHNKKRDLERRYQEALRADADARGFRQGVKVSFKRDNGLYMEETTISSLLLNSETKQLDAIVNPWNPQPDDGKARYIPLPTLDELTIL